MAPTLRAGVVPGLVYAVDQGGGKSGANYHDNLSPTLTCTHGGEPAVAYSFDSLASNSMKSGNPHSGCRQVEVARCLDTTDPNPSKNQGGIAIVESVAYTLKIRSGCEGGGKGALVQVDKSATLATNNDQYLFQPVKEQYLFENHSQDTRYKGPLSISPMLPAQLGTGGNNTPFVVESDPVYCLQGNGIDRADTAGCNGKGWTDGVCYTLNTVDRPAVVYTAKQKAECLDVGFFNSYEDQSPTLLARGYKDPHLVAYPDNYHIVEERDTEVFRQGGFVDYVEGEVGTLRASGGDYGGGTENLLVEKPAVRYIVRRLTPTECARLQGFPDRWGDIDAKDDFAEEEYRFWMDVRNVHAAINGKAVKEYTKQQMLTWYNKLHTDSAEYKMWGNGIALPPALYCMQGIADALA